MSAFKGRYGETIDVVLAAGVVTPTGAAGRQFIIAELTGTADIVFYDGSRQKIGTATGVRVGYDVWIPEGYTSVFMTAATAQTAKIIVSDEQVRYNRIAGTIEARLAALSVLAHGGNAAVDSVTGVTITPPAGASAIQLTGHPNNSDLVWPSGTAGQGTPVQAGATISWPVGSAITAKAGSGTQALYWTIFG